MAQYDIDVDSATLKRESYNVTRVHTSLTQLAEDLKKASSDLRYNRSLYKEGYYWMVMDAARQLEEYRQAMLVCAEFWTNLANLTEDYERNAISLYDEDPYSTSEPGGPDQAGSKHKQREYSRTLEVFGIPLGGLTVRTDGVLNRLDNREDLIDYLFTGKATGGLSGRMGGSAASTSFDLFVGSRDNNLHVTAGVKLGNAKAAGGVSDELTGVGGIVSLIDVNAGLGITHGGTQGNVSLVAGGGSYGGIVAVETNPDSKTMDADAGVGFLGKIGLNYHRDWSRAEGYKTLHRLEGSVTNNMDESSSDKPKYGIRF